MEDQPVLFKSNSTYRSNLLITLLLVLVDFFSYLYKCFYLDNCEYSSMLFTPFKSKEMWFIPVVLWGVILYTFSQSTIIFVDELTITIKKPLSPFFRTKKYQLETIERVIINSGRSFVLAFNFKDGSKKSFLLQQESEQMPKRLSEVLRKLEVKVEG